MSRAAAWRPWSKKNATFFASVAFFACILSRRLAEYPRWFLGPFLEKQERWKWRRLAWQISEGAPDK
jgi:hypothetical protein